MALAEVEISGKGNIFFGRYYRSYSVVDLLKSLTSQPYNLIEMPIIDCPIKPYFHWYVTKLSFLNKEIWGSGEGFSPKLAIIRSLGEALERLPLICNLNGWQIIYSRKEKKKRSPYLYDSNGLAFGLDPRTAILSACQELIEREVVLSAWLNKSPTPELNNYCNKVSFLNSLNARRFLINAKTVYFPNHFGLHVVGCLLAKEDGPPFFICGFGANRDFQSALQKALLEAWRLFWNFQNSCFSPVTNPDIVKTCLDHYLYHAFHKTKTSDIFNIQTHLSLTKNMPSKPPSQRSLDYIDEIWIYPLESIGLVGYAAKVLSDSFKRFWVGKLRIDRDKRKIGEIHPIG